MFPLAACWRRFLSFPSAYVQTQSKPGHRSIPNSPCHDSRLRAHQIRHQPPKFSAAENPARLDKKKRLPTATCRVVSHTKTAALMMLTHTHTKVDDRDPGSYTCSEGIRALDFHDFWNMTTTHVTTRTSVHRHKSIITRMRHCVRKQRKSGYSYEEPGLQGPRRPRALNHAMAHTTAPAWVLLVPTLDCARAASQHISCIIWKTGFGAAGRQP